MLKHPDQTAGRLNIFAGNDWGLKGKVYGQEKVKAASLKVWNAPGRVPFSEAVNESNVYEDTEVGKSFGPTWETFWFDVKFDVPSSFAGKEIHFIWDSSSEALIFSPEGDVIQALNGAMGNDRRIAYILSRSCPAEGMHVHLKIEMSCSGMFGNSDWKVGPTAPKLDATFTLKQCDVSVFNRAAFELLQDFITLQGMSKELPAEYPRKHQALRIANEVINIVDLEDESTWARARELTSKFLVSEPGEGQMTLGVIGHCHIDTAWLWSYAETRRKCARSWATQLQLMEDYPWYLFTCSQPQQYEWLRTDYPKLFERIQKAVADGRFIPTGGSWVEMDCNLLSGESLCRQFVQGQHFYRKYFGRAARVFWLPDTFGYAAQLPQIMKAGGAEYFLTQKLSWNQINKFPHNTFMWEGLDGTSVLTHFPPADTYCSQANVNEVWASVKNHKDKQGTNEALLVFGHGDGGGGPVFEQLEQLQRMFKCDPLPRVKPMSPEDFFDRTAATIASQGERAVSKWSGDLYLELHRGTFTSQAKNKLWNRQSEILLQQIESLATLAYTLNPSYDYPRAELERLWRLVLLNQFHDVIPGSSIPEVYVDSTLLYKDILSSGAALRSAAASALLSSAPESNKHHAVAFNTLSFPREEIVELPEGVEPDAASNRLIQKSATSGRPLAVARIPGGCAFASLDTSRDPILFDPPMQCQELDFGDSASSSSSSSSSVKSGVRLSEDESSFTMESPNIRAVISKKNGTITSLVLHGKDGVEIESVAAGSSLNTFKLFEDKPLYWDAWDVDVYSLEKFKVVQPDSVSSSVRERGPLRASVGFSFPISSKSRMINMTISLDAVAPQVSVHCEVDWQEAQQFLKVEFPVDVRSAVASYEVPFGVVQRPTHFNTSREIAAFEVCGHKWFDLSAHGFGVSILSECKYGMAVHENVMRLSLLRSPKAPDPDCDMGVHKFSYAIRPHEASTPQDADIPQAAAAFCAPLFVVKGTPSPALNQLASAHSISASLLSSSHNQVVVDTLKLAEDDSCDLIARVYESFGGRAASATLSLPREGPYRFGTAHWTNLLEDMDAESAKPAAISDDGLSIKCPMTSFEIKTLRFTISKV